MSYVCEKCQIPVEMGCGECICNILISNGNCPICVNTIQNCDCEVRLIYQGADMTDQLRCPITGNVLVDAVVCIDGYTYERASIEKWVHDNDTSPMTGLKMAVNWIIPNYRIQSILEKCERIKSPKM